MSVLYIVMPAYNEEDTIEKVVREWYEMLSLADNASRLVVADSGSKDRTHEILLKLQKELPKLHILTDSDRQHGPKLIAMYNYAIDQGADYVFQTDSDGQTTAKEFPAFWEQRDVYDVIIGERRVRGDGKARAFVEEVVCILLRLYFGVKVKDANAPFRLMSTKILAKYMGRFDADYNLPNIMLTTFFAYYDDKHLFKEISFGKRQGGVNSINIRRIVEIGFKALGDFRNFKKEMKAH